jgi:type II secretory pathway pseudopilin PulG
MNIARMRSVDAPNEAVGVLDRGSTVNCSKNRRTTRYRGSSLIEVLIGVWILALTILAVLAADIAGSQTLRKSQAIQISTQAARALLDNYRGRGYDGLPPIPTGTRSVSLVVPAPDRLPAGTGTVVITRVDESDQPTLVENGRRRIEALFSWTGRGSDRGSVKLVTLMARYGDH